MKGFGNMENETGLALRSLKTAIVSMATSQWVNQRAKELTLGKMEVCMKEVFRVEGKKD